MNFLKEQRQDNLIVELGPAANADGSWARPVELAVIVPTLNERDNVPLLVERLNRVLAGISWEAIFVDDDSPDGTAEVVRALAPARPISAACSGSAGAVFHRPASMASWPARRPMRR